MPAVDAGAEGILEALPEPALLVGTDGRVAHPNRAALVRLGPGAAAGADLAALCPDAVAAAALRAYLGRCSGSRAPLPGAAALRCADGAAARFRCHAGLVDAARDGRPARLLLRLVGDDERFSLLTRKVGELNEEILRRRRVQVVLEEALRERDLLLRELHHRVKNNIQMLAGMLAAARREAASPGAGAVLEEASRRLAAVGAVHQMLYGGDMTGVAGAELVARIGGMAARASGIDGRFSTEAEPVGILNDAAVPLALILNELVTNAAKHGARADGTPGRIRAGLSAAPDGAVELWVEDEGPGFDPAAAAPRRASGLGLVHGLARQLGGSFFIGRGPAGGARCSVRFREGRGTVAAAAAEVLRQ